MNRFYIPGIIGFIFISLQISGFTQQDSLEIISLNYNNSTTDSSIIINIDYPQIKGLTDINLQTNINKILEEEFLISKSWYDEMILDTTLFDIYEFEMQFSFETGFQLYFNSSEFISIGLNHYQFTGGAHGNYFSSGYNINLSDGSMLKLSNIIQEGTFDILEYECEQAILEQYEANTLIEAGLFENEIIIPEDQDFFIIPGALVIQFDPYEIGPWAMGEINIEIAFEKIEDIISEDVPFNLE